MSDSYYVQLKSYQDSVGKGETFVIVVTGGGKVVRSSAIPIVILSAVMEEIEVVKLGGLGFAVWQHEQRRLLTFAPGMIERIDIEINKGA